MLEKWGLRKERGRMSQTDMDKDDTHSMTAMRGSMLET